MRKYLFYSALPPEGFLAELSFRAEEETADLARWRARPGESAQWKAEWKWKCRGGRFELYCSRSDKGKEDGGVYSERWASKGKGRLSLGTSFGYRQGRFWSREWGDTFRGRAGPCQGGSVLCGGFRASWHNSLWLLAALLAVLACVAYCRNDAFQVGLGMALGAALLVRYFAGLRKMEESPLNQETLAFLKRYSDRWETAAPDREEKRQLPGENLKNP